MLARIGNDNYLLCYHFKLYTLAVASCLVLINIDLIAYQLPQNSSKWKLRVIDDGFNSRSNKKSSEPKRR